MNSPTPNDVIIEEADLADVRKGTFLSKEWCQRFIGVPADQNNEEYRLSLLILKKRIEDMLCKRDKDDGIIVKQEGLGLIILTDTQAVEYTSRRQKIALRHWNRMMRKQMALDESQLTEEVRSLHQRQMNLSSRMAIAMKRVLDEESKMKRALRNAIHSEQFKRPPRIQ